MKSVFLVTNGQEPKMLKKLQDKNALPTQLYLSVDAPTEDLYLKINRPKIKEGWKNLQKTISMYKDINTRRVVRFTLIKGLNDDSSLLKEYVKLFEKTDTDFLEVKAYMFLGYSRKTLTLDNMPSHKECYDFAKLIEENSSKFKIVDECKPSRIVLLKNKNSKYKNFILTDKEKERM
jgi:tRNA wybutosine-synthesizing protein 1